MGPLLTALPSTAALGTPVTLTFQTFPPSVTGRAAFYDGVNLLGTKTLNGGTASLTTIQLPAGNGRSSLTSWAISRATNRFNLVTVPVNPRAVSTLGSRGQIPVWNGPRGLTTGDFNRDGKMDLAVAGAANQAAPGAVSILLGNGDGSFQPAVNYFVGSGTYDVAVGDLNWDGKPDLVVTLIRPRRQLDRRVTWQRRRNVSIAGLLSGGRRADFGKGRGFEPGRECGCRGRRYGERSEHTAGQWEWYPSGGGALRHRSGNRVRGGRRFNGDGKPDIAVGTRPAIPSACCWQGRRYVPAGREL